MTSSKASVKKKILKNTVLLKLIIATENQSLEGRILYILKIMYVNCFQDDSKKWSKK